MSFAFKEDRNQVNTVQVLETDFNSFYDNFYTLSALRVSILYLRHVDLHNRFAFLFPFFGRAINLRYKTKEIISDARKINFNNR